MRKSQDENTNVRKTLGEAAGVLGRQDGRDEAALTATPV
jgi:hypothetical protein